MEVIILSILYWTGYIIMDKTGTTNDSGNFQWSELKDQLVKVKWTH